MSAFDWVFFDLFDETNLVFLRECFDPLNYFLESTYVLVLLVLSQVFYPPTLIALSSFFDVANWLWLVCHEACCGGLCLRDLRFGF